jgi:hypothetical protein
MPIILAIWEAEIGRIVVSGYPRQKINNKLGIVAWACNPSYGRDGR